MSVPPIPDTRVLAVASHVVSGNVGNKIAVFVLQSLGCDVAALNTVQFSNHTGYRQWKGTKVSAQEILDLYKGLKQSYLDDFDMMLTGYIPGAAAVEAVGLIAKELQAKTESAAGSFFWVLDPVMGDEGKLYVAEDVVPAYKNLVSYADLILPNQFEAELLSEVRITDVPSLKAAIQTLHERYKIPHVVITSVKLDSADHSPPTHASVVGSTMTSDGKSRPFKIVFPSLDCYFSGTGDMFAALMVVRMREAVEHVPGLRTTRSWRSDDRVAPLDLPLAHAAEKVLASMHEVLTRTMEGMQESIERSNKTIEGAKTIEDQPNKDHLLRSKAAELRLARNLESLTSPAVTFPACLF